MLSEKPKPALSETRKMTKSTMEKKRRARINNSLTELKSMLAGMIANKDERFDKMEKADILEMTVKCVRQLQRQSTSENRVSSTVTCPGDQDRDYVTGMNSCVNEVIKFLTASSQCSNSELDVKNKLLDHLAGNLTRCNTLKDATTGSKLVDSCHISHKAKTLSFSGVDREIEDCNNNVRHDTNPLDFRKSDNSNTSPYLHVSPSETPLQTQTMQLSQPISAAGSVPSVPFTILLPANFCTSPMAATCVIPIAVPGQSAAISPSVNTLFLSTEPVSSDPLTTSSPASAIKESLSSESQIPVVCSSSPTCQSSNNSQHCRERDSQRALPKQTMFGVHGRACNKAPERQRLIGTCSQVHDTDAHQNVQHSPGSVGPVWRPW